MKKPSQEDFETCRDVLEFMVAHDREYEPHAVNSIASIDTVLSENGFDRGDYES